MPEITAIQPQVKRKKRVSIFLDGEFYCGVDQEIVAKLHLKIGQVVEQRDLQTILRQEEELQVRERCLRLLERRMHSRYELNTKLRQRGIENELAQSALDHLEQVGLINDQAFAEAFIRDRIQLAPMAQKRLELELQKRGIARETIQVALDNEHVGDEANDCMILAQKKARLYKTVDIETARRRLTGFLSRRGYSYTIVKQVVDAIFPVQDKDLGIE